MNPDSSTVELALVILGIPVVIIVVIALISLGPGWTRAGRYRPGDAWEHDPVLLDSQGSKQLPVVGTATTTTHELSERGAQLQATGLSDSADLGGISVRW